MKTRIHVNQHVIKSNKKYNQQRPPLTIKNYKYNNKANQASILGKDGEIVAFVLYSPQKPLACGATVWIETKYKVISE